MTILCIILMVLSLAFLAGFQIVLDKSQQLIVELNRTLELNASISDELELSKAQHRVAVKAIEKLEQENNELRINNDNYKGIIKHQNDEIKDLESNVQDFEILDKDEIEAIHLELDSAVCNLKDYLSNIEDQVEDIETQLSQLDSLL